jgi:hypothetical protein
MAVLTSESGTSDVTLKLNWSRNVSEPVFQILESHYVDFAGILPWWVKYRLLRSDTLEPSTVKYYDKLAVPVIRVAERLMLSPIGKNLLLIGEKR